MIFFLKSNKAKINLLISFSLIAIYAISFDFKKNFDKSKTKEILKDSNLVYKKYSPMPGDKIISRLDYLNKLYGFWLGQCIANWTGLITEMDKIGNIGNIKTGKFYTREDWGKADHQIFGAMAYQVIYLLQLTLSLLIRVSLGGLMMILI